MCSEYATDYEQLVEEHDELTRRHAAKLREHDEAVQRQQLALQQAEQHYQGVMAAATSDHTLELRDFKRAPREREAELSERLTKSDEQRRTLEEQLADLKAHCTHLEQQQRASAPDTPEGQPRGSLGPASAPQGPGGVESGRSLHMKDRSSTEGDGKDARTARASAERGPEEAAPGGLGSLGALLLKPPEPSGLLDGAAGDPGAEQLRAVLAEKEALEKRLLHLAELLNESEGSLEVGSRLP